jgi:BirA family biotin operon repressor/biotin-[acetyl-CoA-carboxylase] ligase
MGKVHEGMAKHGMCWFARQQTAGKGQRGKQWLSTPDANITMSIVVSPENFSLQEAFLFNMNIACCCKDFLTSKTDEEFTIKWPNDLYWRDRKAGGILIENVLRGGQWLWSVIGIGINVNQTVFEEQLVNATSLRQINDKIFDPVDLAKKLHLDIVKSISSSDTMIDRFNENLYKKNELVRFQTKIGEIEATIQRVDEQGRLHVLAGEEIVFNFGEVEWIID